MKRVTKRDVKDIKGKRAVFVIEWCKDFATRRAAEASGHSPDSGHKMLNDPDIQAAIKIILEDRLDEAGVDASWLLYELVDNHRIARQMGNIGASTTALKTIAQLATVDAMAKQRVEVDVISDKEVLERLHRGRDRNKLSSTHDEKEMSFL